LGRGSVRVFAYVHMGKSGKTLLNVEKSGYEVNFKQQ